MKTELQNSDIIFDFLTSAEALQNMNWQQLNDSMSDLSGHEIDLIKLQVLKLSRLLKLDSYIHAGKRVEKGIIAGVKTKNGQVYSALVDGEEFHQWQDVEDIAL